MPLCCSASGDLTSHADVFAALSDCWCVIHVASPPPTSRDATLFQKVNVGGTGVLIKACRERGVQRFVHTSSASVVFDGRDQRNFDESAPKPVHAMDAYTKSKWDAEELVLRANDAQLWTTAIRPHGIFGARDPHFLPVLAGTGAAKKSRYQIGDGSNLVDFTYVENVAYAHALAAVQLGPTSRINGNAYFITNREPTFFWEFITRMHRGWGYALPSIPLPVAMMRPMAKVAEAVGSLFNFKPTFTTQAINYAGSAHYYSSERAVREMGYQPPIDMDEAIRRSLNFYWDLRNKSPEAVKARAEAAKKGSSKVTPSVSLGFGKSSVTKIALYLLTAIVLLFSFGAHRPLYLLLTALAIYALSIWRSSFGVKAIMYDDGVQMTEREKEKKVLITGANRGLGYATAHDLLSRGFASSASTGELLLTTRDAKRGEESVKKLRGEFPGAKVRSVELDLCDFGSIRKLVAALKKDNTVLDVLIHNAGAMVERGETVDGHDAQFQGNLLGSVFLTKLLLKESRLAPAARIVNVSSMMHRLVGSVYGVASWADAQEMKQRGNYERVAMYCRTKLGQILWTAAMQRRFNAEANAVRLSSAGENNPLADRRTIVSVNPGAVATDFITHFIPAWMARLTESLLIALLEKTPKQGVQAIVYSAFSREMDNVGGVYVDNCQVCLPSATARDEQLQEAMFKQLNEWCPEK